MKQAIYETAKMLHILGFVTAIGVTLTTWLAYTQFWKLYETNSQQAKAGFRAIMRLQVAGTIGLMTVIVAGVCMLAISKWSFISLLWFQIKLGLIILIFVNGFTLGRTTVLKLQDFISQQQGSSFTAAEVEKLKSRINTFLMVQLAIYATIIFISVFRPG